TIPSAKAQLIALRTMQICAEEAGAADTVDPLAGSYFVEALTNEMEAKILEELAAVDRMGGIVDAIKSGALQAEVARQAYRFAQGMTFDEYVKFVGTPDNLKREGSFGMPRRDYGEFLRKAFESAQLSDAQREAWQWIVSQPNGPAKMLVISEEWSSDCRRDVPVLARLAQVGGLEMRIFPRDGHKISSLPAPDPKESPNADVMAPFVRKRDVQTFLS